MTALTFMVVFVAIEVGVAFVLHRRRQAEYRAIMEELQRRVQRFKDELAKG